MNIITEKQKINRLEDGVNTLLSLNEEDFDQVVELLKPKRNKYESLDFFYTTDKFSNPKAEVQLGLEKTRSKSGKFIGRDYHTEEVCRKIDIFKFLERKLKEVDENSEEGQRIKKLLGARSLEAYKTIYLEEGKSKEFIDKVFEIVLDDDVMRKFLNYSDNGEYFSVNGKPVERDEYLKLLGKVFGEKDKKGKLFSYESIYDEYYIPEIEKIKERYLYIYDKVNMDRFANPEYKFIDLTKICKTIRDGDEPDWNISDELKEVVLGEMPKDLTIEEKAIYIYCKLCKELLYDEGFNYRNRLKKDTYTDAFSKEHLESIEPGSKVVCWDFARVFAKMANSLGDNIKAVAVKEGIGGKHYSAGFYTDNVSVSLEAIDVQKDGTNDLTKIQTNINPAGIYTIYDPKGLIDSAIKKVMPLICDNKEKTMDEYIQELKSLPKDTVPNDVGKKIIAFRNTMLENNISGNEAVLNLMLYSKLGFFGEPLEKAFLGKMIKRDNKITYKRMVLIRTKEKNNIGERSMCALDTDTLKLYSCSKEDIINALKRKKLVYEDDEHRIKGIDVEEK